MTTDPDLYFKEGCGRCKKFQTPECKVQTWAGVLRELRKVIKKTVLVEEAKWGGPCYTLDGKNVALLSAFNDGCRLSFFKGVLLKDKNKLLKSAGKNSQSGRYLHYTTVKAVKAESPTIQAYLNDAIELEKSGKKVKLKTVDEMPMPKELKAALDKDKKLNAAFEKLTPGRQRSHMIHVDGAKQEKTRINRVEKCRPKILAGKGFLDR
jgi:uncharacterized protein YdeI (YjbR/CyaY-like superfamily)